MSFAENTAMKTGKSAHTTQWQTKVGQVLREVAEEVAITKTEKECHQDACEVCLSYGRALPTHVTLSVCVVHPIKVIPYRTPKGGTSCSRMSQSMSSPIRLRCSRRKVSSQLVLSARLSAHPKQSLFLR
jgi:hypothetical protein